MRVALRLRSFLQGTSLLRSRTGGWVLPLSSFAARPDARTFSGLRGGRALLRRERGVWIHLCVPPHDHHDVRLQYALPLLSVLEHLAHHIDASRATLADALAQLLTIPPYVVGSTVLVLSAAASDRLQTRGLFVIAGSSLAGTGYVCVPPGPKTH